MIEAFNKHPRADRGAALDKIREDLKRSPAETEKLTKQLEHGKDTSKPMSVPIGVYLLKTFFYPHDIF